MAYNSNNITDADQKIWSASGVAADQTSSNMPNYSSATTLTLCEGKASLRSFEADGETKSFAAFQINVDGDIIKESGKQLFREVYVPLTEEQLKEVTTYQIKSNGKLKTVKGLAWPEGGVTFHRRFPTLKHDVNGSVPYVEQAQVVQLTKLNNVGIMGFATDGKRFIRIIDSIAVDAGTI